MSNTKMIKSILGEYGLGWLVNRSLYCIRLKMMSTIPGMEKSFEKKTAYPERLDLFQIDVKALQKFIKLSSEEDKIEIVQVADKACDGVIKGFSSINLNYGNPIDWQLNPLSRKRCNEKVKWFRIPDFDKERGDIKIIWEASRFSHFISLARAYLLTADEKYYCAFSLQLDDWLDKNKYGYGANYKCGQECSIRMVNALLAYTVFDKLGITTKEDERNIKDLIDRCYRRILANFVYAYKCVKNNHTISELMGIIIGSWCCRDEKRLNKAYKLLDGVINEQFTDDGGYRQFSFTYQRLALQDLECILSITSGIGREISKQCKEKIKKSAMLMYQCQDVSGDVPNYGNNDGALIFPVTSCSYRDFRSVINTVYALTTGTQLYKSDKHQEELLWFSGGKDLKDYDISEDKRVSSQFIDAGLFTLRGTNSWAMIVSNDYHSRPGHMDQLHFDLWIDGVNVFCDTGTYSYASNEGKRLIRNEFHNTAAVDGMSQMNSNGPFMIFDWTKRILGKCDDTSFVGKMISSNKYSHKRAIQKTNVGYVIKDSVNTDYSLCLHTPCEVYLEDKCALLYHNGKSICKVISSEIITTQESERSLYYLNKEKITCLSIKGKAGEKIKTFIEIIEGEHK